LQNFDTEQIKLSRLAYLITNLRFLLRTTSSASGQLNISMQRRTTSVDLVRKICFWNWYVVGYIIGSRCYTVVLLCRQAVLVGLTIHLGVANFPKYYVCQKEWKSVHTCGSSQRSHNGAFCISSVCV